MLFAAVPKNLMNIWLAIHIKIKVIRLLAYNHLTYGIFDVIIYRKYQRCRRRRSNFCCLQRAGGCWKPATAFFDFSLPSWRPELRNRASRISCVKATRIVKIHWVAELFLQFEWYHECIFTRLNVFCIETVFYNIWLLWITQMNLKESQACLH